ncbi:unnamed protein product [Leptidea sinapis]|uniref:Uncharacterized protein n=1 Tax=Leptidea sinapis TaxID=189913 RepID=A0A5E4QD69_9NEOP|nr:unnamed protein product [Leptidea sinapis]
MLSGIGPKEHLESFKIIVKQDLPVGYNYHDHTFAITTIKTEKSNSSTPRMTNTRLPFPIFTGYVSLDDDLLIEVVVSGVALSLCLGGMDGGEGGCSDEVGFLVGDVLVHRVVVQGVPLGVALLVGLVPVVLVGVQPYWVGSFGAVFVGVGHAAT